MFHSALIIGPLSAPIPAYGYINWLLGLVRMPLLMLVSGLLSGRLLASASGAAAALQAIRLTWIFSAWLPVTLGLRWLLFGKAWTARAAAMEFIGPRSDFWYIWALALLVASLPLVRRLGVALTCSLALAASFAGFAHLVPASSFSQESLLRYAFFFYLGAFGRDLITTALREVEVRAWLVVPALALASAIHAMQPRFASAPWSILEATACCSAALASACIMVRWRPAAMLVWIGRRTLPIYLAHSPILLMIVHMGWGRLFAAVAAPVLYAMVAIVAALLLEKMLRRANMHFVYAMPARVEAVLKSKIGMLSHVYHTRIDRLTTRMRYASKADLGLVSEMARKSQTISDKKSGKRAFTLLKWPRTSKLQISRSYSKSVKARDRRDQAQSSSIATVRSSSYTG